MTKKIKENIKKNVEWIQWAMDMTEEQYEKSFGVSKETGIKNILNAILKDLEA